MHPVLFKLGPLTIYTYGVFVASGFILGISLALRQARKEGYDPQTILDLVFYIIVAGIVGSRLFYIAQNLAFYRSSPLSVFMIWEGGLVFHGGLLFALPVGWILIKRHNLSFWGLFDLLAPSLAIGQALGRIGCFYAGCCYGLPTQLPWAVTFTDPKSLAFQGAPLHPAQLYAAAANCIIFLALVFFRKHIRFSGQLSCIYLGLHAVFRFVIELYRGDLRLLLFNQTISLTQVLSALLFLLAIFLYFYLGNQKRHRSA